MIRLFSIQPKLVCKTFVIFQKHICFFPCLSTKYRDNLLISDSLIAFALHDLKICFYVGLPFEINQHEILKISSR